VQPATGQERPAPSTLNSELTPNSDPDSISKLTDLPLDLVSTTDFAPSPFASTLPTESRNLLSNSGQFSPNSGSQDEGHGFPLSSAPPQDTRNSRTPPAYLCSKMPLTSNSGSRLLRDLGMQDKHTIKQQARSTIVRTRGLFKLSARIRQNNCWKSARVIL
jgi:hypothetical protein